jgi:hypothetical protein
MLRAMFALGVLFLSAPLFAQTGTRNQIALFKYGGDPTAVEQFGSYLQSTTLVLVGSFADPLKPSLLAQLGLDTLHVVPHTDAGPSSWSTMVDYWKKSSSLALFIGRISGNVSAGVVHSQIFLGDYHGSLPQLLVLDADLKGESLREARDGHALAILFALAQQAEHERRPNAVVREYLQRAYPIATYLKGALSAHKPSTHAPPPDDLTQLCEAVIAAVDKKVAP